MIITSPRTACTSLAASSIPLFAMQRSGFCNCLQQAPRLPSGRRRGRTGPCFEHPYADAVWLRRAGTSDSVPTLAAPGLGDLRNEGCRGSGGGDGVASAPRPHRRTLITPCIACDRPLRIDRPRALSAALAFLSGALVHDRAASDRSRLLGRHGKPALWIACAGRSGRGLCNLRVVAGARLGSLAKAVLKPACAPETE